VFDFYTFLAFHLIQNKAVKL